MRIKNFNRTDKSPIFMTTQVQDLIRLATKQMIFAIESRSIDVGKEYEDVEADIYVLWCECCVEHKDQTEEFIVGSFEKKSTWYRLEFVKQYFNQLDGLKDVRGPEPFNPDFYEFVDLYRSGATIDDLAAKYQAGRETIKRYMTDNFVTKVPINPMEYLDGHAKMRGKDHEYWNLKSKIMPEIDFS